MRETVDEKLHSTLTTRLDSSFKLVSERLEGADDALAGVTRGQHVAAGERPDGGDFGEGCSAVAPRLAGFDVGVGFADQVVGGAVEASARVELVADAAAGAVGEGLAALVEEGGLGLDPAEVGPALVEAGGHPQGGQAERAHETHVQGEVGVAPAAGRQGLDLRVLEERLLLGEVGQGAAVEPGRDGGPFLQAVNESLVLAHVVQCDLVGVACAVRFGLGVEAGLAHALERPDRAAGLVPAHVEEEAVNRAEEAHDLFDLGGQVLAVGAGHVEDVPAGA
ncbi:MAG: hypothetical protein BWZ02_02569 [Lentisphaerae bacterium ADurb.BinA184]|nr:MAG: hypothetical protein BWZ02_02569 [Lentisphaerae bacterium ADurb.BinA184]